MITPQQLAQDIKEGMDTLRDYTVKNDTRNAEKMMKALLKALKPLNYTIVHHPTKIYVLKKETDLRGIASR